MPDILFYHLEKQPAEQVLPTLVERSLSRGWRVCIETPEAERLAALDTLLWTYRDDSFLPHGLDGQGHEKDQPVLLTSQTHNLNGATIRFLLDGASCTPSEDYERMVVLFDGRDEHQLSQARVQWKQLKALKYPLSYWKQDGAGVWEKMAG